MTLAQKITRFIECFYFEPLFGRLPLQTFRYAVCGGSNLVFGWILYFAIHNFVVAKRFLDLGFIVISPHTLTFILTFPVTFLTGFWLQRNITFASSALRERTQLSRYLMVVAGSVILNYIGLKIFVELLYVYPTPSQIIVSLITVVYSYLAQKHFSFR